MGLWKLRPMTLFGLPLEVSVRNQMFAQSQLPEDAFVLIMEDEAILLFPEQESHAAHCKALSGIQQYERVRYSSYDRFRLPHMSESLTADRNIPVFGFEGFEFTNKVGQFINHVTATPCVGGLKNRV